MKKKKKTGVYVFLIVVFVGIFMLGVCVGIQKGIGQSNTFDNTEENREQRVQEWEENNIETALAMANWTEQEEREQYREKLIKWYLEEQE